MRILWVKVGGLWPLNTGGRIRTFHILTELSKRHAVALVGTYGPGEDPGALARQFPRCERIVSISYGAPKQGSARFIWALLRSWFSALPVDLWRWRVSAVQKETKRLLATREFDLCVADFLVAVANVPRDRRAPLVYFAHNVESMIWKRLKQRETRRWRRALLEFEWQKMRRCEIQACLGADLTIAVSSIDRDLLAADAPDANVRAIPTGVDTSYFTPHETSEVSGHLVFTGSMDWYPNEDAILYFLEAILPAIRREARGVSLTVVGRNPSPRLLSAATAAGVQATGMVEDIRPYVARAAVYVVPLRIGGGTRLKIFEALAMGKAVVSTRVGAEGLPVVHDKHFLQADGPQAFASAVLSLLRDPTRRQRLGLEGRRLVAERYSWSQVAHEFEAACERLGHRRAMDRNPAPGITHVS